MAGLVVGASAAGLGGWLPAENPGPCRSGPSRAVRDFDTRELTVGVADRVALVRESRGRAWCRTASGLEGWVPRDCLDPPFR